MAAAVNFIKPWLLLAAVCALLGSLGWVLGGYRLLSIFVFCGLLGSFIVVRKMALMGDALSHAVLPGVAVGFLWSMSKNPLAIFVGATIAGLLGTMTVGAIKQTTRLKEDTILGLVLAAFFAVGICMVTMIQRLPTGNKSGIDKFLFGQAADQCPNFGSSCRSGRCSRLPLPEGSKSRPMPAGDCLWFDCCSDFGPPGRRAK